TGCPARGLVHPDARPRSKPGFGQTSGLRPSYCATSMLFSAWDGSRRMDLRVSNDQRYYDTGVGGEQLWRIDPTGGGRRPYTDADGWARVQVQGMGIASQDLTGDGLPEI